MADEDKCCENHFHHDESDCEEKSVQTPADSSVEKACACEHHDDGHHHQHSRGGGSSPAGSSGAATIDLKQLSLFNFGGSHTAAKTVEEAKSKKFQFWETQPVPKFEEKIQENEAIELDKDLSQLRKEPYTLPAGFQWCIVDINNANQLQELYLLLNENYVEDDDNMFRFDYSPEFLKWALQPPGWLPQWHCGVRVIKSGKLVGFISAIPCSIKIYERVQKMVEINFLCVHKKLRSKRVAPVLIREITRRVNLEMIFQAVYTAGVILPRPVCTCRYWHRSLNPKKLIDVKFSHLGKNMTLQRTLKLYKLPNENKIPGFRPLTQTDVPQAYRLMLDYLKTFDLAPVYSVDEFEHWFLPRIDVIDSYVIEKDGTVTDFVSFYTLPSTVVNHPTHKTLKAAYSFYNVASSISWPDLMTEALIVAKSVNRFCNLLGCK